MTPKPDSRRIDWTLSATPTRRNVRVILIVFLIPVALTCVCLLYVVLSYLIAQKQRTPERSFTAMDFFPSTAFYLAGYEVIQPPKWAGIDAPVSMGAEDDAYASYKPARETVRNVHITVYYASHWNDALNEYQAHQQSMDDFEPVSLLAFQSDRAQEWSLWCTDRAEPVNWLRCAYVARYDEFVIDVSTTVRHDQPSMAEFEYILRTIDQRAIELLGPTLVPTP
jgi:hypothetical protein